MQARKIRSDRRGVILCCGIVVLLVANAGTQVLAHSPAEAMAEAANAFLAALDDQQQAIARFSFDDGERINWHFIPKERVGLPLKQMRTDQQQLAYALLQSAHSHVGFKKSLQIMTLEQILHEMENQSPRRDPSLYHVSIFGEPSTTKTWGWRIEGHHLSVNFTLVDGKKVSSTPSFFGSNPAEVMEGPRKGLRVLAAEEDLARQLALSLNEEQRQVAIISDVAPADVINGPGREAEPLEPVGLSASKMVKRQARILKRLVRVYVVRLRRQLARQELAEIEKVGYDQLHFVWAGGLERGDKHYYRVQGPTFILEYDNTQNDGNHAHSVWREFDGDFGEDLLKQHYDAAH